MASRGIAYRASPMRAGRTTLLFVHGLSGSASAWRPYEDAFKDRYNIIAPDLRGHGLSVRPARFDAYTIETLADDVGELLLELRAEHVVVVSHSLGALVTLELARRYPRLISGIVFVSPAVRTRRLLSYHLRHLWRSLGAMGAFVLASLAFWRGGRTDYRRYHRSRDWDPVRIFDDISRMGPRAYVYALNHLYAYDDGPRWSALHVPAMVVHGSADTMVPYPTAGYIARSIRHGTLVRVEGGNHMLPIARTQEVIAAVEQFLASHH